MWYNCSLVEMFHLWLFKKYMSITSKMVPFQGVVKQEDNMGKWKKLFISETINLIEPKLYIINHWMVPYKMSIINQRWLPTHGKFYMEPYRTNILCVFTFLFPCCDVRYNFCIKTMFGSSLPSVVCRRDHVLFTLFVFVYL